MAFGVADGEHRGGAVGSVTFRDGANVLGTEALASGSAALVLPDPSVGTYSLSEPMYWMCRKSRSVPSLARRTVPM